MEFTVHTQNPPVSRVFAVSFYEEDGAERTRLQKPSTGLGPTSPPPVDHDHFFPGTVLTSDGGLT
jgi:hypothetical protein